MRVVVQSLLHGYKNQTKLAEQLNIKQPTLSAFLKGKHQASLPLAYRTARLAGVHPSVFTDEPLDAPRLADIDGWAEAEAEARRRYKAIPDFAFRAVGNLMTAQPPEILDAAFVAGLARTWFDASSDRQREDAETREVRAQMRAADEQHARLSTPAPPKMLPPAKVVAKKKRRA